MSTDAVVQLEDGRIDLSPVFEDAGKGRYYLKLQPIAGNGEVAPSNAIGPLSFAWDPSKPEPLLVQRLQPGLHEVALLRRSTDTYRMTGTSVWVLVAGPIDYQKASAAFREAQAWARSSGDPAEPDVTQALLRACLEVLAHEKAR